MTLLEKLTLFQKEYHSTITQIQSLMIKATKDKNKIDVHDLQIEESLLSPTNLKNSTAFYNQFIRKEGEKVLNEEEYNKLITKLNKLRNKILIKFDKDEQQKTKE